MSSPTPATPSKPRATKDASAVNTKIMAATYHKLPLYEHDFT